MVLAIQRRAEGFEKIVRNGLRRRTK